MSSKVVKIVACVVLCTGMSAGFLLLKIKSDRDMRRAEETFRRVTIELNKPDLLAPYVPPQVFSKIREAAEQEWPNDYRMQKFTIDNQVKAYIELTEFESHKAADLRVSDTPR